MNEATLRSEICRIGRSLHARGYVHGSTGNISARIDGGFLITATDACLGELVPEALVRVDAAGKPDLLSTRPSKTLALHLRIYAVPPKRIASSTPIRRIWCGPAWRCPPARRATICCRPSRPTSS